nr:unnamed protein product [African swine fever virus]
METFVRLFKDSPQQRSNAWHATRRTQVGGSDLASILGLNPYKSYYITLAEKANLFKKNLNHAACSWGTLFERVSKDLLELFCQTTVIGDNIHIDGTYLGYPGHSNSPDGFCHLTLGYTQQSWEIKTIFNDVCYETTKRIPVLVEIKSPFNRKIKNSVPSYYMPQIQSGLAFHRLSLWASMSRPCFVCAAFISWDGIMRPILISTLQSPCSLLPGESSRSAPHRSTPRLLRILARSTRKHFTNC